MALALGNSALAGGGGGCTNQAQKTVPQGFSLLFSQRLSEGCLFVANIANFEHAKRLSVQLLDPVGLSPKWRLRLDGNAFGNDSDGPGWGIVKGVLWMQGTDSLEMWYSRNYGVNLADGTVIWTKRPCTFSAGVWEATKVAVILRG
ncbi:hypothetical protein DEFR109230_16335 [Deinococcus frigens]